MKSKILFLGFFLFCFGISLAQKETRAVKKIRKISYKINSLPLEFTESEFKLDSIDVSVLENEKLIIAKTHFEKSNSNLKISYYFNDNELVLTKVEENSPKFSDLNRYTEFYFKIKELIFTKFGYNESFTKEFLKNLSDEILQKLNE